MKFFKHRVAPIAIAIMLLTIAGCDWRVVRSPDILFETIPVDPSTMNPLLATDAHSASVYGYIYQSLLDRDRESLELVPELATRWEASDDHLSYTFWLRKDVRWQDGHPFTVDDVIYTFERVRDPKVDSARLKNYFRDVESVKRVGEDAVRFTFKRPYFKALEICSGLSIIPKHIFDNGEDFNSHSANRHPVGTGPYKFDEWKTGRFVEISRNDDYWGEKPDIRGIVYKIVPNSIVAFQLLKKGAIDLGLLRAVQWARQTEGKAFNEKFEKYRYYMPNYTFIGWNMRKPYFDDKRVRRAMTMLVNRKAILDEVLFGQGEIVATNFYLFGKFYDESIKPYPYDPTAARKLLDEAGWVDSDGDGIRDRDGVPFSFTLLWPSGSQTWRSTGIFLKEDLRKVGIEVSLAEMEWAAMLRVVRDRSFDAVFLAWVTSLEPDPYQLWHSSQAEKGSNLIGFKNARSDEIIEKARREFDVEKRIEMYKEFQKIVHEEQPYTFMFTNPSLVAVGRRFENVKAYKLGLDIRRWKVGPWPTLMEW